MKTLIKKAEKHLQRQHRSTFTEQVIGANKEKRISKEGNLDIRKTLTYIYALIGISTNNMPDKTASMVLEGYIKNHLQRYSLSEIRLAFDLGVGGELDYPIKHFQNFNPLFLENVMQSYNRYRYLIIKSESMQLPEKKLSAEEKQQIIIDGIIRFYKKFRLGKYNDLEFTEIKYDMLDQLGLVSFTNEVKNKFMINAERVLIIELEEKKNKVNRNERESIQEWISSIRDKLFTRNDMIINRAKIIALRSLFNDWANMDVDLEQQINEALTRGE